MGEGVLPTVQASKRDGENGRREEERESQTTPRNKDAKAQQYDQGSKAGGEGITQCQYEGGGC